MIFAKYSLRVIYSYDGRADLIALFAIENMRILQSYSLKIPTETENLWHNVPNQDKQYFRNYCC